MFFPACRRLIPGLLVLLVCATGCIPARDAGAEEEREPHFQRGRELARAKDFRAAADAFERALDTNPRSAAAHFELGLLCESTLNDPAKAIFHYERFLKLRPASDKAELARQRINNSKLELAKHFLLAPNVPSVQKEMDKLRAEIERLGLENVQLKRQVELATTPGARAVPVTSPPPASTSPPPPTAAAKKPATPPPAPPVQIVAAKVPEPKPTPVVSKSAAPAPRTHTVKSGDTPATIAKQNGVKLEALLAANPGLDPKRMKIGQVVTLPAP